MAKIIALNCPSCGANKVNFKDDGSFHIEADGKSVTVVNVNTSNRRGTCEFCGTEVILEQDKKYDLHPSSFVASTNVKQQGHNNKATVASIHVGGSFSGNMVVGDHNTVNAKTCSNCGKPIASDAKFCGNCGSKV